MKFDRVLVIDDDPISSFITETMFSLLQPQTKVSTAGGGMAALDKLATEEAYDLILLDIDMPVMDGFEFLSVLKDTDTAVPSVVMLTSSDSSVDKNAASCFSVVKGYLTKPFGKQSIRYLMNLSA